MAKDKQQQAPGQVSIEEVTGKKSRKGFFGFLKRMGKKVDSESNSEVTTFDVNGKKYQVETSHGKCKRYKEELKSGKSSLTGQPLSDSDKAYRKGVIHTMGAQAHAYKKRQGQ